MKMTDMSPVFIQDKQRRERKGAQDEMGHLLFHLERCRVLHEDDQGRVSENELNFHVNEISFFYERMITETSFEKEARGNSKMAYQISIF